MTRRKLSTSAKIETQRLFRPTCVIYRFKNNITTICAIILLRLQSLKGSGIGPTLTASLLNTIVDNYSRFQPS